MFHTFKTRSAVLALGLAGLGAAGAAHAQNTTTPSVTAPSVTLYGIVDQSLRYINNRSDSGGSHVQLENGAITNSRFGLRGTEDLGNDLQAIFRLENGFDPQNGTANQGGKLFGRYAYVGLAHKQWGTVMAGLNGAESFNFFGEFDPLTVGNSLSNSWPFIMTVGRLDNTLAYSGAFGGLNVGVTYGFNSNFNNNTYAYRGIRTSYDAGALSFGATVQELRQAGEIARMWGAAASYTLDGAKAFVGYMGGRDQLGMIDGVLNHPTRTPPPGNFIANPRKDMTLYTGVSYTGIDPWLITGAFYYSDADNINGVLDNDGKRYTAVVVAEYSLSRRTQVYGTVDFNRVTNGAWAELPGKRNQTGLAVGVRHSF